MKLELKLTNDWLEATWYEEAEEVKTQVYCESFSGHPEHITMLRAKALEFGTELDEAMIAECIANFKHPTEEELAQQELEAKISEAKAYLASTDFKDLPRYVPKEGEDMEALYAKRDEAREFIRNNEL